MFQINGTHLLIKAASVQCLEGDGAVEEVSGQKRTDTERDDVLQ